MSRVIVLGDEVGFAARLDVIPGTQVVSLGRDVVEGERFDLLRGLDPQALPTTVFFCGGVQVEQVLDLARRVDDAYPSVQLVMVGEPDASVLLSVMQSGIRNVLPIDVTEVELVDLLRRADVRTGAAPSSADLAAPGPAPEVSRVVTVISPKGGVGKTSIATNVAIAMAEMAPNDVVLVDLDLQFGDVGSTLDLRPTQTMEQALVPEITADPLLLKSTFTQHPAGLFVLCGAESPAANEDVTGAQVIALLRQLTRQFSHVVVDTPAGLDEPTLAALEVTDDAVLVSTMDVSCVRSVRKEADLLLQLGLLPPSRTVVLNLADKQSGLRVKDIEAVVGMPVDVVIPRSGDVQLAANHGQPLMLRKKRGGPFVKGIDALLARLRRQGDTTTSKHRRLEVA